MEFYKGMYLKFKRTGSIYRLDGRANIFRSPAWIAFRFSTGNIIEDRVLMFEDTLIQHIQNNDIEIIERKIK